MPPLEARHFKNKLLALQMFALVPVSLSKALYICAKACCSKFPGNSPFIHKRFACCRKFFCVALIILQRRNIFGESRFCCKIWVWILMELVCFDMQGTCGFGCRDNTRVGFFRHMVWRQKTCTRTLLSVVDTTTRCLTKLWKLHNITSYTYGVGTYLAT